jgi:hypothetical protein
MLVWIFYLLKASPIRVLKRVSKINDLYLIFFIIEVSWRGIDDIKIDDMILYLRYNIINLILLFLYIELNRIDYLLVIYDTQNGITIEAKYVWVA